jgi:glycosyltransferase involved in cell wall biosynthesis
MKAAIINPYFDTLGGGERYTLGVAQVLEGVGYEVDVEWKDPQIKGRLEKRFGLNLKNVNIIEDVNKGDGYEVCFWVSDGSIPLLRARKNIIHFQVPFINVNGSSLMNRMKMIRINHVVCNSKFTQKYINDEFGVRSDVLYPPVSVKQFKPKRKENLILNVGRFSQLKQAKRQDILVDSFKKLYKSGVRDWELILAGGTEIGSKDYLIKLRNSAKGYPIRILESPSFSQIKELYGQAKIFWSASGYGVEEEKQPEKVEHFGITVVEAMASKAIPVVYNAGGHKEIVKNKDNGFLWNDTRNLLLTTKKIINDKSVTKEVANNALRDSKMYSYERFEKKLQEIIGK